MPHQNITSSTAAAQNAATDPIEPNDRDASAPLEARSYASEDAASSSLAPPPAGETAHAMDEGEAMGASDVQQGSTHVGRPDRTEAQSPQGPKTVAANAEIVKGRDPQGQTEPSNG